MQYKKPARYDDLLTVEARILRARGVRVRFSRESRLVILGRNILRL